MRTAWPPLSQPLSDQPETSTETLLGRVKAMANHNELIAWTGSFRKTGANSVARDID